MHLWVICLTLCVFVSGGEHYLQIMSDEFKESLRRVVSQGYIRDIDAKDFYIVDIGAHYGEWSSSVHGLNLFPNAEYLLIEANEDALPFLSRLNVQYGIALLSDEVGKEVDYHMCASEHCGIDTGNSVFAELTPNFHNHATIQKRTTTTLDRILSDKNEKHITSNIIPALVSSTSSSITPLGGHVCACLCVSVNIDSAVFCTRLRSGKKQPCGK